MLPAGADRRLVRTSLLEERWQVVVDHCSRHWLGDPKVMDLAIVVAESENKGGAAFVAG